MTGAGGPYEDVDGSLYDAAGNYVRVEHLNAMHEKLREVTAEWESCIDRDRTTREELRELRAELKKLAEVEREKARKLERAEYVLGVTRDDYSLALRCRVQQIEELKAKLAAAEAREAGLRRDLAEYGEHRPGCVLEHDATAGCSCGLDAALKEQP